MKQLANFYKNKFNYFPKAQKTILDNYISNIKRVVASTFDDLMEISINKTFTESEAIKIIRENGEYDVYDFLEECFEDTAWPDRSHSIDYMDDTEVAYYFNLFMNNVVVENIFQNYGYDSFYPDFDELHEAELDELLHNLENLSEYYSRLSR